MDTDLDNTINEMAKQLQAWRRDFHQYAESGWFEFRTATLVAEELSQLGYQLQLGQEVIKADARMGLPAQSKLAEQEERAIKQGALTQWLPHFSGGFTGIVATLDTGRPGPTLAFRVDMDALDLNEEHTCQHRPHNEGFASCNQHMMHACGHDGHTAIGLGLAHVLKQYESRLSGRIKVIFQPAEEGTRGAKSMMEAGVVDDVDFFVAIHIGTGVPKGEVVCGSKNFLATTKFDVVYQGVAAHSGAKPEDGKNALLAATHATLGLYGIPRHSEGSSRVNVGVLKAGIGRNVIPDHALLKVETRGETNEINEFVYKKALDIVKGAAQMQDVSVDIQLMGAAQSSHPSPQWVDFICHLAKEYLPEFTSVVKDRAQAAGSEDATYFMERVKTLGGQATYMIFGTELSAGHHNERFDFNEDVMTTAVKTLSTIAFHLPEFGEQNG
ncbi:TPA: M20 family metallo-hydrolase [Providencia rettgeri]|uniref:M20 family metallo-hydrolase n=1 Tax=Providencia TaxID=586 RepID=UPI001B3678F3|nr:MULTISPECIES: M20 family metallo-hydrolase [Providencia]EMB5787262.1 M20 family metallo-hydrolase [Providencia rettgeri]MBQ0367025.1 M20 family metallo-hydrolase [Providencia rettgeri]MDK7745058.1 M20 family metallo-hydrolase [Providencia rettgeri]MDK7757450.1 M20 family metallo-hydrolase [Providencia rettgeri]HBC7431177.1 M20 family metallo-hydrolase [Providencia rettgeri]